MSQRPEALILPHLRSLYNSGNREKKIELLDQLCETYGYHRKAAVWVLNRIDRDDTFSGVRPQWH